MSLICDKQHNCLKLFANFIITKFLHTYDRSISAGIGGIVSVVDGSTPVQSRPRGAQLKRAGSADTGGTNVVTGSTSPRNAAHTLLCRTGSQDNPHVEGLMNPGSTTGGTSTSAASPLTKSLPRI